MPSLVVGHRREMGIFAKRYRSPVVVVVVVIVIVIVISVVVVDVHFGSDFDLGTTVASYPFATAHVDVHFGGGFGLGTPVVS